MSEQKRDELAEETVSQEPDGDSVNEAAAQKEMPKRSYILHVLAGGYLVYTGYQLASNVIKGSEGAHWGFLLVGGAFILIGGWLVVNAVKGLSREEKMKRAEEAAAAAEEAKAEKVESAKETGKMSIAQRAKLVDRINEEDAE